ncbi:MAG: hypothetical protein K9N46_07015 [Candidatus Marinimicrobia bacterium]|nr:hypothetical protein [Candidatus Neomarinimicrobiota bacterium]MCF7880471.1 hypothetical protein [Candidatus Neomarinimicrobiota bacterium]
MKITQIKYTYIFLGAILPLIVLYSGAMGQPWTIAQDTTIGMAQNIQPFSLPNTEVRQIHSRATGISYVLYVSLPHNYEKTSRGYPVLFMLDADYSFAIAHNVVEHFVRRDNLEAMILVGIAYPGKSQDMRTYRINRVRDYSPSAIDSGVYSKDISVYSGGGEQFLQFIQQELIPFIGQEYRTSADRGIVGHSLGGLFATWTLLTSPTTFNRYIIISPSLWYDDGMIFEIDHTNLRKLKGSKMAVFFGVGSHENQPSRGWPMIDDMRKMVGLLRGYQIPGLDIESQIFSNETHNSVFPAGFTRGVREVYSSF